MSKKKKSNQVSQILYELSLGSDRISISELLVKLKSRGLALLMAIFAVPAAMPSPAPVLGTILGVPLFFLVIQLLLGKKEPWLPEKIKSKEISSDTLKFASKWLKKIEFMLHPRYGFLISKRVIAIFCMVFALVMMVPLPLTNTVPAFAILLISLGLFQKDGLFVIAGITIGTIWTALLTYATIVAGNEFVEFIKEML